MKSFLATTLLLIFSIPAAAQYGAHAVTGSDAAAFLVPVAGHVVGAGGAVFATDLTIVNFGSGDQRVELEWIPRTGPTARAEVTIPFLGYQTLGDVALSNLDVEGVGAIVVRAIEANGSPDPSGRIDGYARIWTTTQCEPLSGTVSQTLVPLLLEGWRSGSPAYIHGVRQTGFFRTNYGIVNLDRDEARTFLVIINSPLGKVERNVTIAPFSMIHEAVPAGVGGDLSIYIEPVGGEGDWRAYGSSVDNQTGSGWVVPAVQPRTDVVFPAP